MNNPNSPVDLVLLINQQYSNFIKKQKPKNKSFTLAIEQVFNAWGERFGYTSPNQLKGMYKTIKENLKSNSSKTIPYQYRKEPVIDTLLMQVIELNLNIDSYY